MGTELLDAAGQAGKGGALAAVRRFLTYPFTLLVVVCAVVAVLDHARHAFPGLGGAVGIVLWVGQASPNLTLQEIQSM